MKMIDVFQKVEMAPHWEWAFPLDFLAPDIPRDYASLAYTRELSPEVIDASEDFVRVARFSTKKLSKVDIERMAGQLLLAASTELHNRIIVDDIENGQTSLARLLAVMKTVYRRRFNHTTSLHGKLNKFFVEEDVFKSKMTERVKDLGVKVYPYPFNKSGLTDYYLTKLGGSFPRFRKNLVLGIGHEDSFVAPFEYKDMGLCVISNKELLLGCTD